MKKLRALSFKNKILFSTLVIMFFLSVGIALATRWVLVTNMTSELKLRGTAIAQSLAELSRSYILTQDVPSLVSLIFDATQLGERKHLIAYVFILDTQQTVLAHTFTRPFPVELRGANPLPPERNQSIELITVDQRPVYDIAVPVREGIYQIGTIRVGLNKEHIDRLIGKLRITFLGIISVIVVIFFLIIHWLSKYISRPISKLTLMADEISRGNLDVRLDVGGGAAQAPLPPGLPERAEEGEVGEAHEKRGGDDVAQLTDAFANMVTSIKLYRSKLRESEEKYRSLFDSGPDPIFVLDHDSLEILDANPSAEETYGYSREELRGTSFDALVPERREWIPDRLETSGGFGRETCTMALRARALKKGNVPIYVNIHACPTLYGGREAVIVAANDITQVVEKDAQLIQASKMTALGEMSAGVAHELNQPLNAIKMGSEFLKMMLEQGETVPNEQLGQVVEEVSNQVDRASEIIGCLRQFGRKSDLLAEPVNINDPIRSVLSLLGQQLSLQNIEVKLDMDETLPPVLVHKNRIQQVIFNLVANARDAIMGKTAGEGDAGARVIGIRSSLEGERIVVEVSDTGKGIPESLRDKIFEPFFTTKEAGQGMGLGLSISYGIIQDYGGKIDVRSRDGEGASFRLSFPIYSVEERRRQAS